MAGRLSQLEFQHYRHNKVKWGRADALYGGGMKTTKRRRVNDLPAQQASAASSVKVTDREITFDAVFQQGRAIYKHKIFEIKEGSGDWYIVKCDEHKMHFGAKNPVRGAAKHIDSPQHDNLERTTDLAIQTLVKVNTPSAKDGTSGTKKSGYSNIGDKNTETSSQQQSISTKGDG
ncbi:hypothetical protein LA080_007052 [Diaporthe eres]|nr:hypothetical protein LA080_007052 [Diaporthe eres]